MFRFIQYRLMSRSFPTLTIPRAAQGSTKISGTIAREPGKFLRASTRGCPGVMVKAGIEEDLRYTKRDSKTNKL